MTLRLPRRQLALMLVALLAATPWLRAGEPAGECRFCVKDLAADAKAGEELAKKVTQFIDTDGWCPCRGTGCTFDAQQGCLVVRNSQAVCNQVAKFVADLRSERTTEVKMSLHLIAVPASNCDLSLAEIAAAPVFVSADRAAEIGKTLREKHNGRSLAVPTIVMLNGQEGVFQAGGEVPVVRSIRLTNAQGVIAVSRETENLHIGETVCVCPTVCPDQKSIRVRLKAQHTEMDKSNCNHDVNVVLPGKEPLPESLPCSNLAVQNLETTCVVPNNMTAIVLLGNRKCGKDGCESPGNQRIFLMMTPEACTKVAAIGHDAGMQCGFARWARTTGNGCTANCPCDGGCGSTVCKENCTEPCAKPIDQCCFAETKEKNSVTPKRSFSISLGFSIKNDKKAGCDSCATTEAMPTCGGEECTDCGLVNCEDPVMTALKARYHKAVAEGKMDDAKRYARACIEIDPTCFSPK